MRAIYVLIIACAFSFASTVAYAGNYDDLSDKNWQIGAIMAVIGIPILLILLFTTSARRPPEPTAEPEVLRGDDPKVLERFAPSPPRKEPMIRMKKVDRK